MANGHLTGGLSENVAARFAFQVRDRSGYNRNVLLNRDLDDLQSYQARGQLQFGHPDDALRALLSVEYGRDESNGTIRSAIDDPAIAGIGSLGAFRAANGLGDRQDMSPEAEYVKRRSIGASFRVDWDAFANATLTSISAYRDSKAEWGYNQIGFDNPPSIVDTFVFQTETPKTFSQEVRLTSNSDSPLEWLVGAYYQNDDIKRPYQHNAHATALTVFSGHSFYNASAEIKTAAAFGQLGYNFGNGWKVTGGVRYLNDDKSGTKDVTCLDDGGDGACVTPLRGPVGTHWNVSYGDTWDAVTGQGNVEYRINDSALVYASIAQGFKGGGWDFIPPTPEAAQISFDPEKVTNYELGLKSDLFGQRLRVNTAVFEMDYKDLQAQRTDLTCLCLITSNAGSARIRGVEFEVAAAATDGLTLNAAFTALDPKYQDYNDLAGHIYDGKTMQRTPKFKYNLGLVYSTDLPNWPDGLEARVNYTHQSKLYWGPDNISFEPALRSARRIGAAAVAVGELGGDAVGQEPHGRAVLAARPAVPRRPGRGVGSAAHLRRRLLVLVLRHGDMASAEQEIRQTLATMFDQWNREDQKSYMTHYWKSDDMRWSMKGVWYKGWSSMNEIYGADYPKGAMGITALFNIEVQMLADDLGIALYTWTHNTPRENVAGCTSQVFRKIGGAWLVINENSARVPK